MAEKRSVLAGEISHFRFAQSRVIDRQIDELLGIIKGVMADGEVNQSEAEFVLRWLDTNNECAEKWPARELYAKLQDVLADGVLDSGEEGELLEIFLALTGNPHYVATTSAGAFRTVSASLPYNYPLPMVIKFEGKKFCLTGKFDWSFGPRSDIEQAVRDAGGETQKNVTKETDFLVIGDAGNRDWIHSTYGRKVERAVALRDAGQALAIIPEHQIVSRLFK